MNQTGEWLGIRRRVRVVVAARRDRRAPDDRVGTNRLQRVVGLRERVLVVGRRRVLAAAVLRLPEPVHVRLVADDDVAHVGERLSDQADEGRELRLRGGVRADRRRMLRVDREDRPEVVQLRAVDRRLDVRLVRDHRRRRLVPLHGHAEVLVADVGGALPPDVAAGMELRPVVRHAVAQRVCSRPGPRRRARPAASNAARSFFTNNTLCSRPGPGQVPGDLPRFAARPNSVEVRARPPASPRRSAPDRRPAGPSRPRSPRPRAGQPPRRGRAC